jgi:hypothetical protein
MLSTVASALPDVVDASDQPVDRSQYVVASSAPADWGEDAVAPARGIACGVALGAAIWCGIGLAMWQLF